MDQRFISSTFGFIRNNESQFYTRQRKENARVENGLLIIEARREQWRNPDYVAPNARPKQGKIPRYLRNRR